MKKITLSIICLFCLFCLVGCQGQEKESTQTIVSCPQDKISGREFDQICKQKQEQLEEIELAYDDLEGFKLLEAVSLDMLIFAVSAQKQDPSFLKRPSWEKLKEAHTQKIVESSAAVERAKEEYNKLLNSMTR